MKINRIFKLSLIGLALAYTTTFYTYQINEVAVWISGYIISAFLIVISSSRKHFLYGFFSGIAYCCWAIFLRIFFFNSPNINHAPAWLKLVKIPIYNSPLFTLILNGFIIGILSGIALGLASLLLSQIIRKNGYRKCIEFYLGKTKYLYFPFPKTQNSPKDL